MQETEGPLVDGHPKCPPCCLMRKDKHRHDWLVKKTFMAGLYDPNLKHTLNIQLANEWNRTSKSGTKYNVLHVNMEDMFRNAKQLERNCIVLDNWDCYKLCQKPV